MKKQEKPVPHNEALAQPKKKKKKKRKKERKRKLRSHSLNTGKWGTKPIFLIIMLNFIYVT